MTDRDAAFAEYFAARSGAMRGTAYLLCGDWHRAEDLVQVTFTKLYLAWRRIARHEVIDAYTRQILVRTFVSETRRGQYRRERFADDSLDAAGPLSGSAEDRLVVLAALEHVPPRQ